MRERETQIFQIMVGIEDLVVGHTEDDKDSNQQILMKHRLGKLPIVNKKGDLVALFCRSDLLKARDYPMASYDQNGRLLCGAAINTRESSKENVKLLAEAGVDVIVIDSSNGTSNYQLAMIKYIKENFPSVDVIAGNGKCLFVSLSLCPSVFH